METGKIDKKGLRNVILDLGGVILELDVEATVKAFADMGFPELKNTDIIHSRHPFFSEYETGKISTEEFIERVVENSGNHNSGEEIIAAWNAMLQGFRKENVELVLGLREKYRLFLLSNTNALHELHYNRQLAEEHGIANLDRIFEKVYYSHKLKLRKPDAEIFRFVLLDAGIHPEETLYVDDTRVHVDAARELGIRAHHLNPPQKLIDIL